VTPLFWVGILGAAILLYVLLDGFDLGIGILYGLTRDEDDKRQMLAAISPVWDGNETWLVVAGTVLFGAFPKAYAALMSTFYLPLVLMLGALILRGVAFEFRNKATSSRWIWDTGFSLGSLVVAFVQGMTIGALARGIPMEHGHYVGGTFGWFSSFSTLCGLALCAGYSLIGLGWLIAKCEGSLQNKAYRRIRATTLCVVIFLAGLFAYSLQLDLRILHRWTERPYLALFPVVGIAAASVLLFGKRDRRDHRPFIMMVIIFAAALGTFLASFWPYMIPFSLTIDEAAAPPSSLRFMFWGSGLFVFPLVAIYSAAVYKVFYGKLIVGDD
jgi:cytochrome d ubiquinol oxidase subunit II